MTTDEMYTALQQRPSKTVPVMLVLVGGALLAWCAWCCVLGARAARDAVVGQACAEAGHDFAFGDCRAPDIEIHLEPPPKAKTPAPWESPLGPGGM